MADNTTRIAEVRAILRSGVASANVDGQQVTYDLASLRRELRELIREDDTLGPTSRPQVYRFDLSQS